MQIPSEWTFKRDSIAQGFDQHVREQLPWYEIMSGAVAHIARHYIPHGGRVYDLGCSTGNVGNLLRAVLDDRACEFIPIDNSEQMAARYAGPGKVEVADIGSYDFRSFDVAIAFLCLMFLPPSHRERVIGALRANVRKGGAIIIVDKMESSGGYLGTVISRLTLAGKVASGVSAEEVIQKELSLIGVQRPMRPDEIDGAREIFRFGEFAGYVIEAV